MIGRFWLPPVLMSLLTLSAAAQTSQTPASPAETPASTADAKKDQNEKQESKKDPCQETTSPSITRILVGSGRDQAGKVASDPPDGTSPKPVYLSQWLTIEGCGFDKLADKAVAAKKPLQLYLNGMPLAGVKPVLLKTDGKISGARFELHRTEESKDTWAALLGKPKTIMDEVDVSLGVADCREGCTDITNPVSIHLVAIRQGWLFSFFAVLLLLAVVLLWLAVTRGILRDRGPGTPWSLARTQMAWWTFFVVGSFLFIWMVTGNYSSLTNSVLSLIGISTGTALLGAIIDDSKEKQIEQRKRLEQEETQLRTAIAAGGPNVQQDQTRLDEILQQLRALPKIQEKKPMNFGLDILSDEDGVSFHRYQIVIWTLVLTIIFLVRVYTTLSMPDFDAQLLGLTGISAGTYLGFKFPEKTT